MIWLKRSDLNTRLSLIVLASTVLIGIVTVLLMFFMVFEEQLHESKRQTEQLIDAVEYSAAIAGFTNNTEIGNDVIRGLLRSDNVCQAGLHNKAGLNLHASKLLVPETPQTHNDNKSSALDYASASNYSPHNETLTRPLYSPFDNQEIVATLEATLDMQAIKSRAYHQAGSLSLSLLALILLPGLIIWIGISRFITRPILHLSNQLHELKPGTDQRLHDNQNTAASEIVLLANDINDLLSIAEQTVQEEREQRQLAEHMEQKYQHLAHHDGLTGLPNRSLFIDRLQQMLSLAQRDHTQGAVLFIDLDKFKEINDTYGHDIGDLLLKEVAARLLDAVRTSDTVGRMGGDEFVVLLPAIEQRFDARLVGEKIVHSLSFPFHLAEHVLNVEASIGIALYPDHGSDEDTLIKHADAAMYIAKRDTQQKIHIHQFP